MSRVRNLLASYWNWARIVLENTKSAIKWWHCQVHTHIISSIGQISIKKKTNRFCVSVNKHFGGGLATECVVREKECHTINNLSLHEAATLVHSYGSAHLAFSEMYNIKEKENILIFAGTGGDGLAALEIAHSVYKGRTHAILSSDYTDEIFRGQADLMRFVQNGKVGASEVYKNLERLCREAHFNVVYDGGSCGMIHLPSDL